MKHKIKNMICCSLLVFILLLLTSCADNVGGQRCGKVDFWQQTYEFKVDEITDEFKLAFTKNAIYYQGNDAYSVNVVSEDPSIVEIVSFDKDEIMDHNEWGGITVKCLREGATRIKLSTIYDETGEIYDSYATVIVFDESVPYEDRLNRVNASEDWTGTSYVDFASNEYVLEADLLNFQDQLTFAVTGDLSDYGKNSDYDISIGFIEMPEYKDNIDIGNVEKDKIVDSEALGGLPIKALRPGIAYVRITVIQNATGGIRTSYAKIIVVDPASTQPAETTS